MMHALPLLAAAALSAAFVQAASRSTAPLPLPLPRSKWGTIRCPAEHGATLKTPSYASSEPFFTACSEITIDTPVDRVYQATIGFARYSEWNQFVREVRPIRGALDHVQFDDKFQFTSQGLLPFQLNATSNEVITVLQPGAEYAISAWRLDDGAGGTLQRAEHPNILTAADGSPGKTLYVSYESYYGIGGALTEILKDKLQTQFELQARNIKAYVEGAP